MWNAEHMAVQEQKRELPLAVQSPSHQSNVLVVDDSRFQRRVLMASLKKLGFNVAEAASGEEALDHCRQSFPDIVLSDWMMPGMSGLEFCKAFRDLSGDRFAYFIILTSKSEKAEVARGLDAGADDFLSKPVDKAELRARISAGERNLKVQKELARSNALLSDTLDELQSMYDSVDRDLQEAKMLQQSLLRERYCSYPQADLSLFLRSSGHVGGDLVGHFPAGDGKLGLFAIDVSGHGISSALMTARLAGYLSGTSPEQNIALEQQPDGSYTARPPADVVTDLNDLVLDEVQTEHYFTFMLLIADLRTGQVVLSQAGHPHPVIQRANGQIEQEGTGGFPVGLMWGVDFEQYELSLNTGDRLIVVSDGVTECPDPNGVLLEEAGMARIVADLEDQRGPAFFDGMIERLSTHATSSDFPDDVSGILLEYFGGAHPI